MATIITTDGTRKEVKPHNGTDFQWSELSHIVGGYIELVRFRDEFMVVNEGGKQKGLPVNDAATYICHFCRAIAPDDYIVGDVLICKQNEIK